MFLSCFKQAKFTLNFILMTTLERLNHIVADLTILAQKVRLCHWNVEGPGFLDYHEFFEEYYTFLSENVDDFAERVRALDAFPVATFGEMLTLSCLTEKADLTSKEMVTELLSDSEKLSKQYTAWILDEEDPIFQDMMVGLVTEIDKKSWMLRAMKRPGLAG